MVELLRCGVERAGTPRWWKVRSVSRHVVDNRVVDAVRYVIAGNYMKVRTRLAALFGVVGAVVMLAAGPAGGGSSGHDST